jgi:hypothetical protein
MTRYLISFASGAMDVGEDELPAVADAAHAVIRAAQDAGVYVTTGGIDESVPAVLVAGDGSTSPDTTRLDGGFTVIDVDTREEAVEWAAKIAVACRCPQELRAFQYDPLV